jgi:photosystem II oxygen-evolving enhancer protein 3
MGSLARHLLLTTHASLRTSTKPPPPSELEAPPTPTRRTVTSAGIFLAITSAFSSCPRRAYAASEMTTGDLKWGTRSFIMEKYFQPGLTPEEAAARIRHTAEGMRTLREMLERMAWKYALYYVRQKSSFLDTDLKNAMAVVPEGRRKDYVRAANQLVDDMTEVSRFCFNLIN